MFFPAMAVPVFRVPGSKMAYYGRWMFHLRLRSFVSFVDMDTYVIAVIFARQETSAAD